MHQELCQELCGHTTPLHTDVALLCSVSAWRNISVLLVHFACASWMCAGAFLAFLCTPELGWVCSKAGKMFFGFPWWLFLQAKSRVVLLPSTGSCQEQGVYSPYLLFALWECLQDFVMAHWVLFFIPGSWVLNKIRKKKANWLDFCSLSLVKWGVAGSSGWGQFTGAALKLAVVLGLAGPRCSGTLKCSVTPQQAVCSALSTGKQVGLWEEKLWNREEKHGSALDSGLWIYFL